MFDQFLDAIDQVDAAARSIEVKKPAATPGVFAAFGFSGRARRRAMFAELHRLRYRFIPDLLQAFGQAAIGRFGDAVDRFDDRLRGGERRFVQVQANVFALTID